MTGTDDGIVQLNKLNGKINFSKFVNLVNVVGIVPLIAFPTLSTYVIVVKKPNSFGN